MAHAPRQYDAHMTIWRLSWMLAEETAAFVAKRRGKVA